MSVSGEPDDEPTDESRGQLQLLGQLIRDQRERAELSMRELARRADISNPYLSQVERGLHEPSVRVLTSIARALNLSADALLRGAGMLGESNEPQVGSSTAEAIAKDPHLTAEQQRSLLLVYESYLAKGAEPEG